MQAREISARESTRVQAAPVDLEFGKFEPGQVVRLFAIAAGALGAGALGGLLLSWGAAGSSSSWGWLAALGLWVGVFGALLLALGFALAGAVTVLAARSWWRHQARVDDWHFAQLAAYEAAGGQEREREVSMRGLTLAEPLHVLGVALAVAERAQRGERSPWSSTQLRGDVWFGNMKLGQLGKGEAEDFSKALAQLGLVRGRVKGAAGQLATADYAEVLQLVASGYGKVRPGAPDRAEQEGGD